VLIATFIRKQLRLRAHRVTKVETSEQQMMICIDRLGNRRLRWSMPKAVPAGAPC
jgi:hypothetical protein